MFDLKNEPMVKNSTQVHTTTDYFLFKPIEGNRKKNLLHLNRLKKSIIENYLFTIIIVNEKYEIIDGNHRFSIIQELKFPLNYIICHGYGLSEVHILNQNSKTWNADDYLEGYCGLGYEDYIKYAEFKKRYGIGHVECMTILGGYSSNPGVDRTKIFFRGEFKIKDYQKGCDVADKIEIIGKYYTNYRRRSFVYAILGLLKNKNFEYTEFIQKLKIQPTALEDCTNTSQYLGLIEEIYNYRRRIKVNLRYSFFDITATDIDTDTDQATDTDS
jgi:hypothetical protein